jgi:hypothetical protein
VTSSPAGLSCSATATCSASFVDGTTITLTASSPDVWWTGPCDDADGQSSCTFTITASTQVKVETLI